MAVHVRRQGGWHRVDDAVAPRVRSMARRDGVIGVFWGDARTKCEWTGERCIVVHVRRKLPLVAIERQRLPHSTAGMRVDVIEVACPAQQWLDHTDAVSCDDLSRGFSTASVLARRGASTYALVSGHGSLPVQGGALVPVFDPAAPMGVTMTDPDGTHYRGQLVAGHLVPVADFGFAQLDATAASVSTFHYGAGRHAPLQVRASAVRQGEAVAHYSIRRRRRMLGVARHFSISPVMIPGVGGRDYPYEEVLVVDGSDPQQPFSVRGDSGSVVVDEAQRVVGTVVGGDPSANLSYVQSVRGTMAALGGDARLFYAAEGT